MKTGCPYHPKTSHLMHLLKIDRCTAIGILEGMWHYTAEWTPTGLLSKFNVATMVSWIDAPVEPDDLIEALLAAQFLERIPAGLYIHDWHIHATDAVHRKLAITVSHFANGTRPSLTSLPISRRSDIEEQFDALDEGQQIQTEIPQVSKITQPKTPRPRRKKPQEDPRFNAWWEIYPRKVKQKRALDTWLRIFPDEDLYNTIMAATKAQLEPNGPLASPDPQFIPYPSTWLNDKRWNDAQPTPTKPTGGTPLVERDPTPEDLAL